MEKIKNSKELKEVAKKYLEFGLQVVLQTGDAPLKNWQKNISTKQTLADIETMIVALEKRKIPIDTLSILMSNGLCALDIDLKHIADEEEKVNFWSAFQIGIKEKLGLSFWGKLVIEKTKSNGFHFYFRADINDTKDIHKNLAYTKENATLIEFLKQKCTCYPTANYELIQGDFSAIATITTNELNTLIDFCKSLCKKPKTTKTIERKNKEVEPEMAILESEIFEFCLNEISKNESFVKGNRNSFLVKLASYCKKKGVSEAYTISACISNFNENDFNTQQITASVKGIFGNNDYPFNSEPYNRQKSKKEKTKKEKEEKPSNIFLSKGKFYTCFFNHKTNSKEININLFELLELLYSFGFRRFDKDNRGNYIFIQIIDNVVEEVSKPFIIDYFIKYLNKNHSDEELSYKELLNKIYRGIDSYFSKIILERLNLDTPLNFITDTKDKSFFYFKNGIVTVSQDKGISFGDYSKMGGYIWKNQIIDRNFKIRNIDEPQKSNIFKDFIFLLAKRDEANFYSLMTLIGYLLHDYKNGKRKAINFTDSSLEQGNNGRSGKTLLCKAIGKLRVYGEISGKNFKPDDKHRYQTLKIDTQFVNLNDMKENFNLECIYNDITEYVSIEGKNEKPIHIQPTIAICTNRPLFIESASDRDRVVEFEFSDYFSENHSPKDEFGHWFFSEWDDLYWSYFDNFMLNCTLHYLNRGIITPANTNLAQRKLVEFTCKEFIYFCESKDFQSNIAYDVKDLFNDFRKDYEDYNNDKFKQRRFSVWLDKYAEFSDKFEGKGIKYLEERKDGNYKKIALFSRKK